MIEAVIQGVLNGFGSAIGTYMAFKYGINHLDKIPIVKDKIREYMKK